MKQSKSLLTVCIALTAQLVLWVNSACALEEFLIDPEHSRISFRVRHLGLSEVTGNFTLFSGRILFAKDDLLKSRVDAVLETKSISTGVEKRDKHLRSPDFFDISKFPKISYLSSEIIGTDLNQFTVKGVLTMRGVSLPVELQTKFLGLETDPWGYQRAAFSAQTSLNRRDFGLIWSKILESGALVVGDQVNITLDIQAVKKQATPPGMPQVKDGSEVSK